MKKGTNERKEGKGKVDEERKRAGRDDKER